MQLRATRHPPASQTDPGGDEGEAENRIYHATALKNAPSKSRHATWLDAKPKSLLGFAPSQVATEGGFWQKGTAG